MWEALPGKPESEDPARGRVQLAAAAAKGALDALPNGGNWPQRLAAAIDAQEEVVKAYRPGGMAGVRAARLTSR